LVSDGRRGHPFEYYVVLCGVVFEWDPYLRALFQVEAASEEEERHAGGGTITAVEAPLERIIMTEPAKQLLDSFDTLSDADKHWVAVEILRRFGGATEGDVPDAALVEAADELFRALDAEEAGHAPR
jgi:hypothetical protein